MFINNVIAIESDSKKFEKRIGYLLNGFNREF